MNNLPIGTVVKIIKDGFHGFNVGQEVVINSGLHKEDNGLLNYECKDVNDETWWIYVDEMEFIRKGDK